MRLAAVALCTMVAVARADVPVEQPAAQVDATGRANSPGDPLPDAGARPVAPPAEPIEQPIVGFAVRGDSKLKPQTLGQLSHTELGERVSNRDIPRLEQALLSSELFKSVAVRLEPAPGDPSPGVILVATLDDKHSWIVAPTLFVLPGNSAFGVGYAENNFKGLNQKFLMYAQVGTRSSLLFATFLDPAWRGSRLTWRADLYAYRRALDEYANPHGDPSSVAVERTTTATYIGGGALLGWRFLHWLVGDLRLRGAYVYFRDTEDAAGAQLMSPEADGWDVSMQARLTLDRRNHRRGVTWGSYAQLHLEPSIPGLDSYGYQFAIVRAYHSWRLFEAQQLELRGHFNIGRHLPAHEEMTLGGVADLRGYGVEQFRGDLRAVARAEYSVPLFDWRFLAFRALAFYDLGYVGFHNRRDTRNYLPNQLGAGYRRSDVGGGLRVYLSNIVLPLVGFDVGYGLEGEALEIYFEVGLTDF